MAPGGEEAVVKGCRVFLPEGVFTATVLTLDLPPAPVELLCGEIPFVPHFELGLGAGTAKVLAVDRDFQNTLEIFPGLSVGERL